LENKKNSQVRYKKEKEGVFREKKRKVYPILLSLRTKKMHHAGDLVMTKPVIP
jgi:hypothetical protein